MTEPTGEVVTDVAGPVAWLDAAPAGDRLELVAAPARLWPTRAEVVGIIAAVDARAAEHAGPVVLRCTDPVVRDEARRAGFVGALRAPLVRAGPPARARDVVRDPAGAVAAWLPDARVEVQAGSAPRRLVRRMTTGLAGGARISATRGGVSVALVAPLGPDALTEAIASVLDTLLDLAARLGPHFGAVPTIRFAVADSTIAGGSVAGNNAGAGIALSPAYVDAAARSRIRRRHDARSSPALGSVRRVQGDRFPGDLVVVHEAGHSIDQAEGSGRLSDTIAFRRRLGLAVGVDSIEQALRADWLEAPAAWRAAREQVVGQLSAYATTNCVELFAEAFVGWYLRVDAPLVLALDAALRDRYPDLP